MSSNNTDTVTVLSSDLDPELHLALIILSTVAFLGSFVAVTSKLVFVYVIPVAWKCCLLAQDISALFLSLGLVLVTAYIGGADDGVCRAGGFFMLFGLMDTSFNLVLLGLTLIFIQNPSKMSQLSTFRYSIFLSIVVPQKIIVTILVALPVSPLAYFDDLIELYPLACFPIRQEGLKGATFGAILFFIVWTTLAVSIILSVANALRFLKGPSTKIHASSPSIWQIQKMEQGKQLHKHSLCDVVVAIVATFIVTLIVYTNGDFNHTPQWVALISLAVAASFRVVLSAIQFVLWSSICCNDMAQKKEPYHRLKQLELIRNEGPGKLRLRASWTAGRGMWKRGLLKVYGPSHIKAWAQEIVVLGLLRKSRSASVLQCLWTSNSNPYYETMTLISGDIVTNDSRLTCLELTSSGTLHDLLKTMDVPLPEPCQKTIMHDIAEGLSYLHEQNVLHRNITSSAVYLKGSVQCLVLRAAVGDFEDAQIYGTLLTGSPNSNVSRKRFFFPDIRAYALVGIEMLSRICECRQREKQPYRRTAIKVSPGLKDDNVSLKHHDRSQNHRHHNHHHHHHHHHHNSHNNHSSETKTDAAGNSKIASPSHRGVVRYEIKEMPYSVPGEAEYNPRSKSAARKDKILNHTSQSHSENKSDPGIAARAMSPVGGGSEHTQQLDRNWTLQPRQSMLHTDRQGLDDDSLCEEYTSCDNDRFQHSQAPGITYVKDAHKFEFPNNSVFKSSTGDELNDDLGMIEEEIDRSTTILHGVKGKNYKQGGYVTSKTEDGREIFIPAIYKAKSSGANSSSGYGSASDIYTPGGSIITTGNPTNAEKVQASVYKTTSAATISSFEDDGLEVLPGMTDVDEKISKGDRMLRELLKAKQDAKVEMLIESYEERVKRGELRPSLEGLPIGVVFPKKNRQGITSGTQEPGNLPNQIEQELEMYDALDARNSNHSHSDPKQTSPRPKTAQASMNEHLQRRTFRPMSASNSTFSAWNARSSLKRSKARHALKRALSGKGSRNPPVSTPDAERGTRGKEVEMKYAARAGSAPPSRIASQHNASDESRVQTTTLQNAIPSVVHQNNSSARTDSNVPLPISSGEKHSSISSSQTGITQSPRNKPDKIAHVSPTLVKPAAPSVVKPATASDAKQLTTNAVKPVGANVVQQASTSAVRPGSTSAIKPMGANVVRKPSQKSRPAPPPPPVPSRDLKPIIKSPPSYKNMAPVSGMPPVDNNGARPDESPRLVQSINESSTSANPESSISGSTDTSQDAVSGLQSDHVMNIADQIETDMNNIIQGKSTNMVNDIPLPAGIRLLEDGFDSASVSSDESCLCAAAALQAVEEGYSCPSEAFSHGTCSCACSNCVQDSQRYNKGSSWTGSQDSESWSNSNSLSSYDTNMHRRKISNRKRESPGDILAPDEQYPSSGRHNKQGSSNNLHPRYYYSPKRNRRHLGHRKGNYPSSASETSSAASRRYQELIKKGVPLRVSVVSGDEDALKEADRSTQGKANSAPYMATGMKKDERLYSDLENNGFFETDPEKQKHYQNLPEMSKSSSDVYNDIEEEDENHYCQLSTIPSLEEIIKEIPDETGHYPEEAKAFLNRPESDISVKALQAVLSRHGSTTDGRQIQDAELIIDRIFSQQTGSSSNLTPGVSLHTGLELDDAALLELAILSNKNTDDSDITDIAGLLMGMDSRHIRYCHSISSRVHLVNLNELLPANEQAFDQLKTRLQVSGAIGNIGNQLLELYQNCWLNEAPPSTAAIVDRLTDHITETEL